MVPESLRTIIGSKGKSKMADKNELLRNMTLKTGI